MNKQILKKILFLISVLPSIQGLGQFIHNDLSPEFRYGSLKYNCEFRPYFELHPILPDSGQTVVLTTHDSLACDTLLQIHRVSNEIWTFEQNGQEKYRYYRMLLPIDSCLQLFRNRYEYYTVVGTDGYLITDEFSMKQIKFDSKGICCAHDIQYKSGARHGKSIFYNDSIQFFDNDLLIYTIHHDKLGNIDSICDNFYKAEFSKMIFNRHPFFNILTLEKYTKSIKNNSDDFSGIESLTFDKNNQLSYLVLSRGIEEVMWFEIYNYIYLDSGNVDCIRNYPGLTQTVNYRIQSNAD